MVLAVALHAASYAGSIPASVTISLNNRTRDFGGVAERLMAAVLKTAVRQLTVGSNPTPSVFRFRFAD